MNYITVPKNIILFLSIISWQLCNVQWYEELVCTHIHMLTLPLIHNVYSAFNLREFLSITYLRFQFKFADHAERVDNCVYINFQLQRNTHTHTHSEKDGIIAIIITSEVSGKIDTYL